MSTSAASSSGATRWRIVHQIKAELERANVDGISRETLPNAREGQLDGYLAGLQEALRIASSV